MPQVLGKKIVGLNDGAQKMDTEKNLFTKYGSHIALLVKAVERAIAEGRLRIEDGVLVPVQPNATTATKIATNSENNGTNGPISRISL